MDPQHCLTIVMTSNAQAPRPPPLSATTSPTPIRIFRSTTSRWPSSEPCTNSWSARPRGWASPAPSASLRPVPAARLRLKRGAARRRQRPSHLRDLWMMSFPWSSRGPAIPRRPHLALSGSTVRYQHPPPLSFPRLIFNLFYIVFTELFL